MIQPGQVYRSCDPRDSIRILITSYRPGDARAHVVDAVTRKRFRQILVKQLHESPVTATGRRRRTGYVLDSQTSAAEAPEGPQERPEGGPAAPCPPEAVNGAQAGADGLRLREVIAGAIWDTPSTHPDAIANAVYARLKPHLAPHYQRAVDAAIAAERRAQQAEATVARVRALADRLDEFAENALNTSDRQLYATLARDIRQRIDAPPAHNAGPTVAECAEADRLWWTTQKHGE
ncbi:hypothetical protein [Streptomyces pseudogriseolus]|uniref:hypothetical protein n=1 Tax=Streptomyces pseudogriseolus TaxID=36817 RepID=UPI003658D0A2